MTGSTIATALALGALVSLTGCLSGGSTPPGILSRSGREISVCGQLIDSGTRVVLWNDPFGYDAYRGHRHFEPDIAGPRTKPERVIRFDTWRRHLPGPVEERVRRRGWTLDDLQQVVHQVVVHYDAVGTSAGCFRVLHDVRGLSAHFLIDLDGTVYQTLDLKERAWHAGAANDHSIGIEIANIGAYADEQKLTAHYEVVGDATAIRIPAERRGHLSAERTFHPARPAPVRGTIQGQELSQYDFTDEQYVALTHLLATLVRVFPKIHPDAPRTADGSIRPDVLPDHPGDFEGIVGHYHLTPEKVDPGPAFDWSRVLGALPGAGAADDADRSPAP